MVTILLLVYHKLKQIGLTQRTRDKSPTHHCRDKQFQAFSLTASLSIFIKSHLENPQDKMINPYINQCRNYFQSFPIIAIVLLANLPIPRPSAVFGTEKQVRCVELLHNNLPEVGAAGSW